MIELMNYEGCGKCPICDDINNCRKYSKPVIITFNKSEKWDNWGHMVTAFKRGDVVQGSAVIKDNKCYCATAESTIYTGVSDFIALDNVTIEAL